MDIKEVERLIEIFEASSLSELSLELGNGRLSMKKGGAVQGAVQSTASEVSGDKSAEPAEEKTAGTKQGDKKVIKAPFVGTFYRALGPAEKPFVEVGQQVKKGDLLLEADLEKIKSAGLDTITPVLICNTDDYNKINLIKEGEVSIDDEVLKIS